MYRPRLDKHSQHAQGATAAVALAGRVQSTPESRPVPASGVSTRCSSRTSAPLAAAVLRRRIDPARRARQRPSDSPSSVSVGCSLPARTPIACQYAEGRSSRQDLVGPPNSLGSRQIAACFGSGAFPPLIGQKTRSGPSRSPGEPRARPRCRRPVRVEARPDRRPWCGPCVDFRYVDRSKAAHAAGGGLWTGNRSAGTGSTSRVS